MGLLKWQNEKKPSLTNLLDEFFDKDPFNTLEDRMMAPAVNVRENDNDFILEVATPGLNKKDLDVQVDSNNNLIISAELNNQKEEKLDGKYTRKEFSYSSFRRFFPLPDNVDAENIKASHENGMLVMVLPKRGDLNKNSNRTIEIN